MDQQPIVPPGGAGGIDFAKACGLTIGEAEQTLCQGVYLGDHLGDCTASYGWGSNFEVVAAADPTTGLIQRLEIGLYDPTYDPTDGYDGGISFASPDRRAAYFIGLHGPVQKDGQTFALTGDSKVDELYRGLIATFAPQIGQAPAGVTCMTTKECVAGNFGNVHYLYIPVLGLALWMANANVQPSGVNRIDLFLPR